MNKIEPKVDIAFKKIFGVEENKDLLISLINSIVSEEDQVVEVTLLNPYNAKNFKNDKLSILDIKATNQDGKKFNIEIQITDEGDYDKRALYYWAKLYTEQLEAGENYQTLAKTIGIHILNFTSVPGPKERYHNIFHVSEKETGVAYFSNFEMHTIELSKFTENLKNDLPSLMERVKTSLDLWLAFLTRHNLLDRKNLDGNSDVGKALEVLEVMNFTKDEREKYDEHLKWLWIEASTLKKRFDEGIEVGKIEGKIKGIEIGEHKKATQTAKNMLSDNLPCEVIAKYTGLSEEEILKLSE